MKKLLLGLSFMLLLFTGCTNTENTPTKRVEEFLGKYQSMDSAVLAQLDKVIASDNSMSDAQKEQYRALMEKQYQNLSYKIKDEKIDGDNATVDVEIEVYDYATSITESRKYYDEHKDEFKDAKATVNEENETTNDNAKISEGDAKSGVNEETKYIDYKIKELKNVSNKSKYDITFHLTKVDNEWRVDDISDMDRQKLHGLYEG